MIEIPQFINAIDLKRLAPLFIKSLLFAWLSSSIWAQPGVLDLTDLANYANQPVPDYIQEDNTPAANPITDLGATLGRVMFYDKRLSRTDTISCASCHQQDRAFSDLATASTGVNGTTHRHSMRLINVRFAEEPRMFWDERASSVEDQSAQPIQDHVEMGFSGTNGDPNFATLVNKMSAIEVYQVLFSAVFGDAAITEARIELAMAQFVRSIQSFDSRYDTGLAQVGNLTADFSNFTAAENSGKRLFMNGVTQGGANCHDCHSAPEFDIDDNSRNNGVIGSLVGGTDLTNTRAPSLRDMVNANGVAHTPFMHDGSLANLQQVITHYNAIPANNANLDRRLQEGRGGDPRPLNLSATAQADLVAFLATLTGQQVYTDPKWSSPFAADGTLSLVILDASSLRLELATDSAARLKSVVVPHVAYQVQQSTDLLSWQTIQSVRSTTDELDLLVDLTSPSNRPSRFFRVVYQP